MVRQILCGGILITVAFIGCARKDPFSQAFGDLYAEAIEKGSLEVSVQPYYCVYGITDVIKLEEVERKILLLGYSQLKRMNDGCTLIGDSEHDSYFISGRRSEVYRATRCCDGSIVSEVFIDLTNNKLIFSCPHTYW